MSSRRRLRRPSRPKRCSSLQPLSPNPRPGCSHQLSASPRGLMRPSCQPPAPDTQMCPPACPSLFSGVAPPPKLFQRYGALHEAALPPVDARLRRQAGRLPLGSARRGWRHCSATLLDQCQGVSAGSAHVSYRTAKGGSFVLGKRGDRAASRASSTPEIRAAIGNTAQQLSGDSGSEGG